MPYNNWRLRCEIAAKYATVAQRRAAIAALKINFSQPTPDDEGYYRKPVTEKLPNGHSRILDWVPVAYFLSDASGADGVELCGVIGAGDKQRNMTPEEVGDEQLWSWVVSNPISYEEYEHVADKGGRWSDEPLERAPADIVAGAVLAERVVERTDNLPAEIDPLTEHKEGIANATSAARASFKEVTSNEQAAQAEGAKNRIAELRLAADKAGRALYEPPYREYKRLQALWSPMVGEAQAAEDELKRAILVWREKERRRIAAEAAEAARLAREQEEANQRAADRAIARAEPEPAPVVTEAAVFEAPAPPKPTYGKRTTKVVESWHFDSVTDWAAVIDFYKGNSEIMALFIKLAERDVKAGRDVPGVNKHWGVI